MDFATLLNVLFMGALSLIIWRSYLGRTYAASQIYHTFWPRFLASFPDSAVIGLINTVVGILLALPVTQFVNVDEQPVLLGTVAVLAICIQIIIPFLYTIMMHARSGQTVGKMLTGVRVVDAITGDPITTKQAWLRDGLPLVLWGLAMVYFTVNLALESSDLQALKTGNMLDGLMVFLSLSMIWWILEILTMFSNPKRRALHDYIAGTVVIRMHIRDDSSEQ